MTNNYWNGIASHANVPVSDKTVRADYTCVGCQAHKREFFIYIGSDGRSMQKVGQHPAWDIKGDRNVEKMLGRHKSYLRRGLICESQGYGIAAFAYYRRITEEIIDDLISDIGDLIPPEEKASYDAAYAKVKTTRQTSEKIDLVKDLLPRSLVAGEMNPLGILHRALSEGLHAESDERCLQHAETIREALAFLASQVAENKAQKQGFSEKMRKLLDKKT